MNQVALEEEIRRLEKETRQAGSVLDQRFLDLRVEVDRMHLEIAALKSCLTRLLPEFAQEYPRVLACTLQETDPESQS